MKEKLIWGLIILLVGIILYATFTDLPGARVISTILGKIAQALHRLV